ncbi:hypothetical protein EON65_50060 [archaeon]|nr:MAG: hypothetical protein EON65_50060 [archaeon]
MGMEQIAVRAVMLKTIDIMRREGFAKVKSVFCADVKGYLYVEAVSEAFAKEIINGLKMVYISSLTQV